MKLAVLERLLDDDVVHERLGDAAKRLRDAVVRARRLPAGRAVQDKRTLILALAAGGAAAAATNRLRG